MNLRQRLQLSIPLVVAPMAGGPSTPRLVAAAHRAGALGSLGAAYLSPEAIAREAETTRALGCERFAINLFAPEPCLPPTEAQLHGAIAATRPFREELGLPTPELRPPYHPDFGAQVEAVLAARPAVFSFTFGPLPAGVAARFRNEGIFVIGTATTLEEGRQIEANGADAVVAQGVEAGGHRGIFDQRADDPGLSTVELTRGLAHSLKIPVISAGGIMDREGVREAFAAGAELVQLGTAFLLAEEAGTSPAYRRALLEERAAGTELTRAFSGRIARGIRNTFLERMRGKPHLGFPAQNAFTRDIRNAGAQRGCPGYLSLWAGTGYPSVRAGTVAEIAQGIFANRPL
jgi:nitronate monooxygenase